MSVIRKNVVFLDNLNDHWKTDKVEDMSVYSKWMDFVKISNRRIDNRKIYTNTLAKIGNQYAQSLLRQKKREVDSNEIITCGINKQIVNALKKWSKSAPLTNKYALFDWDGTICCTNLPASQLMPTFVGTKRKTQKRTRGNIRMPSKKYLDDMFVYMIHPERIEMMRDLFLTLRSNGVHIHILTQNPAASIQNPHYRSIYIEMIWRLFTPFRIEDAQSVAHSSAPVGSVLNEKRCKPTKNLICSADSHSSGSMTDAHTEYEKQYIKKDESLVQIYSSSSHSERFISREEINAILHSTIDYTNPGELPLKRNIIRSII